MDRYIEIKLYKNLNTKNLKWKGYNSPVVIVNKKIFRGIVITYRKIVHPLFRSSDSVLYHQFHSGHHIYRTLYEPFCNFIMSKKKYS